MHAHRYGLDPVRVHPYGVLTFKLQRDSWVQYTHPGLPADGGVNGCPVLVEAVVIGGGGYREEGKCARRSH